MRKRTGAALVVVLLALAGGIYVGVEERLGDDGRLVVRWTSDTARPEYVNHHGPAAGNVSGTEMAFVPVSGERDTDQCSLVAVAGPNGSSVWRHEIPRSDCAIHAVADATLADYDGDGTREVLVATTEETLAAYHPTTGERELRYNLSSYGYTQPVVADLLGDGANEIVVMDVRGSVFVVRPDGTTAWAKNLTSFAWGQPTVADLDGDRPPELAVGLGNGDLRLFERDGETAWHRTDLLDDSVTWMTTGEADGTPGREIVAATANGTVAAVDGEDGRTLWKRDFGELAAVHAFGDGDGDGDPEVYAVAEDAKLRSLDASDGSVEWTTTLTTGDVQMTPPPTMGDVDGDGNPELVAVTNGGRVAVVAPDSGEILATYERDVPILERATLADATGGPAPEVYVIYGDGRVVALDFQRR